MQKIRIFISSVQTEFVNARKVLFQYILSDPLLGKFFEPFLFEFLPSMDQRADQKYLEEVEKSDIYLGILGKFYNSSSNHQISATEQEFDHATRHQKTRLIFVAHYPKKDIEKPQQQFILKAQKALIRKKFSRIDELKSAVYAALIRYLEEKEIIRSTPFDASYLMQVTFDDLDPEKIKKFVQIARKKRGFPISEDADFRLILTHLNLINQQKITNSAVLLFGKKPQNFFIASEVKCAHFHGTIVEKPIPFYQVYKGDVFELVDQAVNFVLSKIDYSLGTREKSVEIPGIYEIPQEIIREAIVNAVVHRDYTSNGSVQVMLFNDRLEIWNPGSLPLSLNSEKLKKPHSSLPTNPLLAEPMYLAGYIERLGTGTFDIIRIAKKIGLKEPDFTQEMQEFKTVIYRKKPNYKALKQIKLMLEHYKNHFLYPTSTPQVPHRYIENLTLELRNIILVLDGEMRKTELMKKMNLQDIKNFTQLYLDPAIKTGYIEKIFENPNHPKQKYRLTKKGLMTKKMLNQDKKNEK